VRQHELATKTPQATCICVVLAGLSPRQGGKRGRSASAYGSDVRGRIGVEELPELGLAVLRVPADPRRARGAVDH